MFQETLRKKSVKILRPILLSKFIKKFMPTGYSTNIIYRNEGSEILH